MLSPLEVTQPAPVEGITNAELRSHIDRVLNGWLPGFVISASMPDAFSDSIAYAKELGMEGGVNSTTMTFNYDGTSHGLTASDTPRPEDWEALGITPLHADGEEGDRMLSINQGLAGAYDITVFRRGPGIAGNMPIELWDRLQSVNMPVLLGGEVDTSMLDPKATRLSIMAGQTVVFNPSHPHMGVTRQAPRRSNATFFRGLPYSTQDYQ